jgi:hypothetical protein
MVRAVLVLLCAKSSGQDESLLTGEDESLPHCCSPVGRGGGWTPPMEGDGM